jgi:hypothetical protein
MSVSLAKARAVISLMDRFVHPWWVCGGWALDLLAGEVTREHHDIEIGIIRKNQWSLRTLLKEFDLFTAVDHNWVPWKPGTAVVAPMFQVQARQRETQSRGDLPEEFEFFLNDVKDRHWIFRRDWRIAVPLGKLIVKTRDGIPCLRPEIQLLHKAKHHRPQDEADFVRHVPLLDADARAWLREALRIAHPRDAWIDRLG